MSKPIIRLGTKDEAVYAVSTRCSQDFQIPYGVMIRPARSGATN
jgi:hypothetical protein